MTGPPETSAPAPNAFVDGMKSAFTSVFCLLLVGTYVGIGALAHDFGFSVLWLTLSTLLVWAAPAQVILVSLLGTGAALVEVALAVTLSSVRLFPMVVALMPLLRGARTRTRHLLLPTHFTAVSMWVESLRLLPDLPREQRVAFSNGLGAGYMATAVCAGFGGFYLAAELPPLFAGGLLFLTPMAFLLSITRNSKLMVDRLALVLGLVIGPLLAARQVELDLMWTGIAGGTIAYAVHRMREAMQ